MKEIIYHASYKIIDKPSIEKGKITKDFGYGFYCTRSKEQAEKLANIYTTPVINAYELSDISDLKVKVFEEYNEEWLDFVVSCRNGNTHEYDIVEGFTTDDSIFEAIDEYLDGHVDKLALLKMMKTQWNNRQISFHTEKALDCIEFKGELKEPSIEVIVNNRRNMYERLSRL